MKTESLTLKDDVTVYVAIWWWWCSLQEVLDDT